MFSAAPRTLLPRLSFPAFQRAAASTSTAAAASSSTTASSFSSTPSRRRRNDLPTTGVDLVAPPDPLSNIRPIIYASKPATQPSTNSPYSAAEFPPIHGDVRLENMELEYRLRRERVDLMNHRFWANTNNEFNAQLALRLAQLPPASDPPSEEDIRRKEDVLTKFYADWQMANQARQIQWVREWWREIWEGLKVQTRLYVLRGLRRGRRE
ncbi:hypothetical protein IAT38_005726 [Cryptococcus sp. DSM 104549]